MPAMKHNCVIFDLDGTLLDTLEDLRDAVNRALANRGHSPRSLDEVRLFVGNGVMKLIERAVPEGTPASGIAEIAADFRRRYDKAINVKTRPYPGILELLQRLRAAGVKICVNSNKYDPAVRLLCEAHFSGLYDVAVGESATIPKKPSPAGVEYLLSAVGAKKSDAVYVGDSSVDFETAKNAEVPFAWVSWGFRRPSEMPEVPPLRFDDAGRLSDYLLD